MEDEKTTPAEPIPFPNPEPFAASRSFIEQMNAENEGPIGESFPQANTADWLPSTGTDPIHFLIDRVDRVIEESAQLGPENLSTKAGVLAALYQAQALRQIADLLSELVGVTEDGKTYIRTMRVYRQAPSYPRRHPQDIPNEGWQR